MKIKIIGAGLAGCEAAYQLAKRGYEVELYESKPIEKSDAHTSNNFCELVCSNSLKSDDINTAHGLLKAELKQLDCFVLSLAEKTRVPAGGALAVDREKFSLLATEEIRKIDNIKVINQVVKDIDVNEMTIVATGPLTLGDLAENIKETLLAKLSFFDAASPIVSYDSIDLDNAFCGSRYGKGGDDDYINCPMDRDEYYSFVDELVGAKRAILKDFEKSEIFEGCMPVEIMAQRGRDSLRFGPLKPVGFTDPKTDKRPYAIVQLRKENTQGTMYNLVGFQTNLKFNEQKRVFSMIPALKNAEFLRYGVMHRNTYIDAPKVINHKFQVVKYPNVFVSGQLSGVEGYVESIASGLCSAIYMDAHIKNIDVPSFPTETMIGSLCSYISTPNANFQPMNSNFGILPPIVPHVRDKNQRKIAYSQRSLDAIKKFTSIK